MKIAVITGGNGMLAQALKVHLHEAGYQIASLDRDALDIRSSSAIEAVFKGLYPVSIVFNCAAMTNVDACETAIDEAYAINAKGPGYLAQLCSLMGVPFVHFSTDYIFDGKGEMPYTEDDVPHPLNVYGKSKLAGEEAVLSSGCDAYIFRLQWLYGAHGTHFVGTMSDRLRLGRPLRVVDDQWGSPSWTLDIAKSMLFAIEKKLPYGIYHLANQGYTSWFGFTQQIREVLGLETPILPVSSIEFPRPAPRPLNSRLSMAKLVKACPDALPMAWENALELFLSLQ